MARPRLALVPGEPAGIGPELVVRAAQHDWNAELVVVGDGASLRRAAATLGLPLHLHAAGDEPAQARSLALVDVPCPVLPAYGKPEPGNAAAVVDALGVAAQGCMEGRFDGMVTGPVHKGVINDGGIPFTGTTGLLARIAGREVVMMLANPSMRVALQTVHLPLREVPARITADAVAGTLRILERSLRDWVGIDAPVIAVLGLNPHAGEGGHLGREEIDAIEPALAALRAEGMHLLGPLPADTAFLPARLAGVDAVLAMYHDQGLPVLKHADFAQAVNISLGLPWPRVAVDHGTALELAGSGTADPSSLFAAIRCCTQLAGARR